MSVPTRGSDVGIWDVPVNGDFTATDGFFGGIQTVSASSSPITLTVPAGFTATPSGGPTQAQNAVLRFTGTLTSGVQVTLPMPGYMIIENLTTGAFALTFRAIGSGEIIGVEQGSQQHVYNDGTNVRFVNLPPVGSYLDVCDAATPLWITSCTKPPYLNCDGSTFNATTYPYLNTKLGGNTLPDFRGVVPAYLNQGTGRLTSAGSGLDGNTRFSIVTSQTQTLTLAQTPTGITSSGGSVTDTLGGQVGACASGLVSNPTPNSGPVATPGSLNSFRPAVFTLSGNATSNNTGGAPHPIVQPTTIGGIRLIRAG